MLRLGIFLHFVFSVDCKTAASSVRSPISRPRVKTRSKSSVFELLAKEGAVLQSIFSGDNLLLNCSGYSECGYTKATSDTCTSFNKTLGIKL